MLYDYAIMGVEASAILVIIEKVFYGVKYNISFFEITYSCLLSLFPLIFLAILLKTFNEYCYRYASGILDRVLGFIEVYEKECSLSEISARLNISVSTLEKLISLINSIRRDYVITIDGSSGKISIRPYSSIMKIEAANTGEPTATEEYLRKLEELRRKRVISDRIYNKLKKMYLKRIEEEKKEESREREYYERLLSRYVLVYGASAKVKLESDVKKLMEREKISREEALKRLLER